ncbi:hypothetical protein AGABI2DRAFT_115776 [Agaricus bisporus var. bisporus H97]|uniref:hypothetical protein n=1 Tax=Agaricus bisporus var. bisporus (strain H97 / ATCC MYA-4626 / FGSC 10389) TaxID=936046 RepID=UPI00029F4F05|nr:hypothetical protein AGABI2DRAFT_115776 [Agaricus bisporus var. bisporus H97]EKV50715.1 hypothetical protein AGABI2DRAFT_115776 [Agaricus bisporus var. bisporus H97]
MLSAEQELVHIPHFHNQKLKRDVGPRMSELRSPIYKIPVEVLTQIFQQVVDVDADILDLPLQESYSSIGLAITLSSISFGFRQVALRTADLWRRVTFKKVDKCIHHFSPLLRHSSSRADHLDLTIYFNKNPHRDIIRLVAEILCFPAIRPKVKALRLDCYVELCRWGNLDTKLTSFLNLDTLIIALDRHDRGSELHLSAVPLRRLHISGGSWFLKSISLHPSVQVLHLDSVPLQGMVMDVLKTCPNLVECSLSLHYWESIRSRILFSNPIILQHLRRLSLPIHHDICTVESLRDLKLPALEFLKLGFHDHSMISPSNLTLFCRHVSTTLKSLSIDFSDSWEYGGFRRLFELPFPNLEHLELCTTVPKCLADAVRALIPAEDGNNDLYFPRLCVLALEYPIQKGDVFGPLPGLVLDLLNTWKVGETSNFHLDFKTNKCFGRVVDRMWSPELREELKLMVERRQFLEVTRNSEREWLYED